MIQRADTLKRTAAGASLGTNLLLTGVKLVAAILTGSVSLFSEAAHSTIDVIASALTYASVQVAAAPPDDDHPYGHGKVESLAGFGESILLLGVVIYIVMEAVPRLISPVEIHQANLGIGVMGFSAVASFTVGSFVAKVGRKTESQALRTNGHHLMIDVIASMGVLLALVLNATLGWKQADSVVAILIAAWIARVAFGLAFEACQQLIDRRLPDEELESVTALLQRETRILSYHKLRTRSSGSDKFVELHIVVPREFTVVQAHEIADSLEKQISHAVHGSTIVIHVDPFDPSKVTGETRLLNVE